jgi:hypothetical protein
MDSGVSAASYFSNSSYTARGIRPSFRASADVARAVSIVSPNIVYDFPAPVWPYAITQALRPWRRAYDCNRQPGAQQCASGADNGEEAHT